MCFFFVAWFECVTCMLKIQIVCDGAGCLAGSVLNGVGRLEVNGNDALTNVVIVTNAQQYGNVFVAEIDGMFDLLFC